MKLRRTRLGLVGGSVATLALLGSLGTADSSSHREAPLITEDPVADNTDTYAFVSPDRPDTVTVVANWIPLQEPAGGPNFSRFGDDVLYEIKVDTNGDGHPNIDYQFRFKTVTKNPNTFLYNTGQVTALNDADLNVVQTYSVSRIANGQWSSLGQDLTVAPANIGPRSTPNYEQNLGSKAAYDLANGYKVFAGPRDDPFFVDLGSIFDLAGLRPLNEAHLIKLAKENGVDNVKPYNVHTIALQIPISTLKNNPNDPDPIIGVWSTTYRRQTRVFQGGDGDRPMSNGNWVQISRLGMPLVNEVVIPLGQKDKFNASHPVYDAQFGNSVVDPELAKLIPVLYPGVNTPPAPRNDLVAIFLTGVKDLNQPANVKPSEMIRLNTAIKPKVNDPNKQNRLGLLAGETDGFPNGRRLVDDVVDISLRAVAGGTPFTPQFNIAPNNALTDGVDANDMPFLTRFPYVAAPKAGYDSRR